MNRTLALLVGFALASCGGDDGTDPDGTPARATPLTIGTPVVGTISSASDVDFYVFTIPAGGANVRFQTFDSGGVACDPANEYVDPYIKVFDANETLVAEADDVPPSLCEDLTVALAGGTSYVSVAGYQPYPFDYTLSVTIP
jgi:hypothetical protein